MMTKKVSKKERYEALLKMSYNELVEHLWNKYGAVRDDYFSEKSYNRFVNGEIKTLNVKKKAKRTEDGLYIHHVDENKYVNPSNAIFVKAWKIPYDAQKKERLVYCDLFEHLILHALIGKETRGLYGLGGCRLIRDQIIDSFIDKYPFVRKDCVNAKRRAYLPPKQAKELLATIEEFRPFYETEEELEDNTLTRGLLLDMLEEE
ncbi:hypothetical protein ACTXLQ_12710 [Enterococcus hirae]